MDRMPPFPAGRLARFYLNRGRYALRWDLITSEETSRRREIFTYVTPPPTPPTPTHPHSTTPHRLYVIPIACSVPAMRPTRTKLDS